MARKYVRDKEGQFASSGGSGGGGAAASSSGGGAASGPKTPKDKLEAAKPKLKSEVDSLIQGLESGKISVAEAKDKLSRSRALTQVSNASVERKLDGGDRIEAGNISRPLVSFSTGIGLGRQETTAAEVVSLLKKAKARLEGKNPDA